MLRVCRLRPLTAATNRGSKNPYSHKTSNPTPCANPGSLQPGAFYFLSMFLAMKKTFAGRSPRRRMK